MTKTNEYFFSGIFQMKYGYKNSEHFLVMIFFSETSISKKPMFNFHYKMILINPTANGTF